MDGNNMSVTLYIFTQSKFSNLQTVFLNSEKLESDLTESNDVFDCYEASDIAGGGSCEAGIIKYCLGFQWNMSKTVTVIRDTPISEIDNALTALGLVEAIDYVALIDEDEVRDEICLEGFQHAFRGFELLSDFDVVGQPEFDSLNEKFNSMYKYTPTF